MTNSNLSGKPGLVHVEAINGLIQAAKARARGYSTKRNLITIAYLIGGKLTHLPASPYHTTSGTILE